MGNFLRHINSQQGMTSAWELIHSLVTCLSVLESCVDQVNGLFVVANGYDDQVLNIGLAILDVFSDLELLVGGVQQVVNVLHVYLHKRQTHWPFIFLLGRLQLINYVVERKRYQTLILAFDGLQRTHCVCLACSCLPVDK